MTLETCTFTDNWKDGTVKNVINILQKFSLQTYIIQIMYNSNHIFGGRTMKPTQRYAL